MDYSDVKKNILRNSISNYVRIVVAMGIGLVTFRLLYQGLDKEDFGFWTLLWSLFGYGVLMDFGMGFSAQKRTAELTATEDWDTLSEVLSTIFYLYLGIALVIFGIGWFGQDYIVQLFNVSPENVGKFKLILVIFFGGVGLNFPFGIFPEILCGQQRIVLSNYILVVFRILNLLLLLAALHFGWGLLWIFVSALFCTTAPDMIAAIFAMRNMPKVKLRPAHFRWSMVKETLSFSMITYVITMTNLLLAKSDQFVLSVMLPVALIAVYQAGAKVAEIYQMFTRQLQDTLAPAAAHLHALGEKSAIQDMLKQMTRLSVMVGTPLYLLCTFYLRELICLLTGDSVADDRAVFAGQLLLAWYYVTTITHSVCKQIFVVIGHHKRLFWLGLGEAAMNVALSVFLVWKMQSIVGVCIGSLVPALFFGWFFLWPWTAREAGSSYFKMMGEVLFPVWAGCIPMLAAMIGLQIWQQWAARPNFFWVMGESVAVLAIGFAGLWRFGMHDPERNKFRSILNKIRRKR
jgi:O-antigen/teichoic acid export membrane protein